MVRVTWRAETTVTDPEGEIEYESGDGTYRIRVRAAGQTMSATLTRDTAVALARRILLDCGEDPDTSPT